MKDTILEVTMPPAATKLEVACQQKDCALVMSHSEGDGDLVKVWVWVGTGPKSRERLDVTLPLEDLSAMVTALEELIRNRKQDSPKKRGGCASGE